MNIAERASNEPAVDIAGRELRRHRDARSWVGRQRWVVAARRKFKNFRGRRCQLESVGGGHTFRVPDNNVVFTPTLGGVLWAPLQMGPFTVRLPRRRLVRLPGRWLVRLPRGGRLPPVGRLVELDSDLDQKPHTSLQQLWLEN